jgi:glyoxylase-like metal-dependent hydrolase (beta-lactamase superfamily II)/rhodanese-related sulfurtransferase
MIFRQLFDSESSTYTYLLADAWSREAVLIDPVIEQVERDASILEELRVKLVYTLDTHVHADHVTGAAALRARLGSKVVYSKTAGVEGADLLVSDGDAIRFGLQALEVRSTPGHTEGCVTYVSAMREQAFTGDALLIRGCGRTDFQQGDARTLFRSLRDKVFSLPDETLIYPGHDYKGRTVSSVLEERLFNPRLGGSTTEDEFVEIMDHLKLSYPRKIDVAVPANQFCGDLGIEERAPPATASPWPAQRSPTGAPHLSPVWLSEHRSSVHLVDVREPDEFAGPDGHIDGAQLHPMSQYLKAAKEWDKDEPVVTVCRSGGRSDRAAMELEKLGFKRVGSLAGGMLRWNELGLPVAKSGQG